MDTLVHQASALRLYPSIGSGNTSSMECDASQRAYQPAMNDPSGSYTPSPSLFRTWYNSTTYKLIVLPTETHAETHADASINHSHSRGVYACQTIPGDVYLGDLEGERVYAWEVEPNPYILWIEDELMIDCTQTPRCILAMIREGFYDGLPCNCELIVFPSPGQDYLQVGFKTTRTIRPGEELVYQRSNAMP